MPARTRVPGIAEFRDAASKALHGYRDPRLSTRPGGGYDLVLGSSALLWSREVARDQALFRQVYVESARGAALDRLVEAYYTVERVRATYGTGKLVLVRPTVGAGAGTVYAGTRVLVVRSGQAPEVFAVAADTDVGALDTSVPVPIRATRMGAGVAISADSTALRLDDSVFDATFVAASLVCGDGQDEEKDEDYLARARAGRRDRRPGYYQRIVDACHEAGAANVVALHAGTFGAAKDFGLNYVYVGDASFTTPPGLQAACAAKLEGARVAGCDVQILTMQRVNLTATIVCFLIGDPGSFSTTGLANGLVEVLVDYFEGRSDWWSLRYNTVIGTMLQLSTDIQSVGIHLAEHQADPALPETPEAFPDVVTRYALARGDVSVMFTGPQ